MLHHNQNMTWRKFEVQAYVDVINTADAFKLSRLSKYVIKNVRTNILFNINNRFSFSNT